LAAAGLLVLAGLAAAGLVAAGFGDLETGLDGLAFVTPLVLDVREGCGALDFLVTLGAEEDLTGLAEALAFLEWPVSLLFEAPDLPLAAGFFDEVRAEDMEMEYAGVGACGHKTAILWAQRRNHRRAE
jgi:hypothetical protein